MDDMTRILPSNCSKVFIQRDFSDGTAVKFQTKFPAELDGKVKLKHWISVLKVPLWCHIFYHFLHIWYYQLAPCIIPKKAPKGLKYNNVLRKKIINQTKFFLKVGLKLFQWNAVWKMLLWFCVLKWVICNEIHWQVNQKLIVT